jgi:hypothetical protein
MLEYVSKTTVQVNETHMQDRRQKLLNLNKIRSFDESHPISVSGDARYNRYLLNMSINFPQCKILFPTMAFLFSCRSSGSVTCGSGIGRKRRIWK